MKRTNGMVKRAMTRALPVAVCTVLILAACKNPAAPEEEEPKEWVLVGQAGFSEGAAEDLSLAFDSSGIPYIGYFDEVLGLIMLLTFDGTAWTAIDECFTTGFILGRYPTVAIDSLDMPQMGCLGADIGPMIVKWGGTSWDEHLAIGFDVSDVSFVLDSSDTAYLAYVSLDSEDFEVWVERKEASGSWIQLGNVAAFPRACRSYSLALSASGIPYVAGVDYDNGKVTVMTFGRDAWESVGPEGFSTGIISSPSLAVDPSGIPYIAFQDYGPGLGGRISVMRYVGGSWTNVGLAGFSAESPGPPDLIFDSKGTPYVAYGINSDGIGRAYVMAFDGTSWVEVDTTGFITDEESSVVLGMSSSGTLYAAFPDGDHDKKVTVMKYE